MDYNVENETIDFDKLIIEIYDAALTRKWGRVLAQCNKVFLANKTFLVLRDVINDREVAWRMKTAGDGCPSFPPEVDLSSLSALKPFFFRLHEGDIFDTCSPAFRSSEHFSAIAGKVLTPLDAEKTLAALVLRDDRYEAYLGVCRPEQDDDFSKYEEVAFKRLVPHFVRAARFFRDEEIFRQQRQLAQGVYEHIKTAFVVCDSQLRVQACNSQAEQYLNSGKAVALNKKRLVFAMQHQHTRFCDKVQACLSGAEKDEVVHVVDDNVDVIEIFHIHRLASQAEEERREPLAVVNIVSRGKPDWQNIQSCYALNKREVLIARMLYKCASYRDIAAAAGLTTGDVEIQVQRLIKAMGVKNEETLIDKLAMFSGTAPKFA